VEGFFMVEFIYLMAAKVYAVGVGVEVPTNKGQTDYTFPEYVCAIYKYSLVIGASLSVLMIIWAGYKYMTSQGNQTQISDAKDIIIGTLIGFALLVSIIFILSFLNISSSCL